MCWWAYVVGLTVCLLVLNNMVTMVVLFGFDCVLLIVWCALGWLCFG